jgi:N-acetylmuramic acid 6-phosphate (MurNAc-6-P) etherase
MTAPGHQDPRLTEQRNPRTERIDVASSLEIADLLAGEDARVGRPAQTYPSRLSQRSEKYPQTGGK